jgi:hypothetical protein
MWPMTSAEAKEYLYFDSGMYANKILLQQDCYTIQNKWRSRRFCINRQNVEKVVSRVEFTALSWEGTDSGEQG